MAQEEIVSGPSCARDRSEEHEGFIVYGGKHNGIAAKKWVTMLFRNQVFRNTKDE